MSLDWLLPSAPGRGAGCTEKGGGPSPAGRHPTLGSPGHWTLRPALTAEGGPGSSRPSPLSWNGSQSALDHTFQTEEVMFSGQSYHGNPQPPLESQMAASSERGGLGHPPAPPPRSTSPHAGPTGSPAPSRGDRHHRAGPGCWCLGPCPLRVRGGLSALTLPAGAQWDPGGERFTPLPAPPLPHPRPTSRTHELGEES